MGNLVDKTKMKLKKLDLQFNEKGHAYEWDGKLIPGVTEILKVRQKEFLMWWTAKEAVGFLKDRLEEVKELGQTEWEALLQEAKKAWTVRSGKAKDSGKIAHNWIEEHIRTKEKINLEDHIKFTDNDEADEAIKAFLRWEDKVKPEWIVSEMIVCGSSGEHRYGGTFDFLAKIDGKLVIGDFKTSGQFSEEYALQLAAYQQALDQMLEDGEPRPTERLILRIPKDGADAEEWHIKTDLSFDIKTFNALLVVSRWNVYIKNRFCDEQGKLKI